MLINFAVCVVLAISFFYARFYARRWFEKAGKSGKEGRTVRATLALIALVMAFPALTGVVLIVIAPVG